MTSPLALTLASLLVVAACQSEVKKVVAPAAVAPQVRATVITIETTLQPAKKTFAHTVAIAGDRARSTDETDQWRLFDLKANSVTFVDEVTKTYRTESLQSLVSRRQHALAAPLLEGTPHATIARTNDTRSMQGATATRWTLRAGNYARDLWIGTHPAIPPQLFAMMTASDLPASNLGPMMKSADAALLATRGFPLAEHAELPFGNKKLVVDRTVTKIETKNVPAALFNVPRDFKAPAASRRPAS